MITFVRRLDLHGPTCSHVQHLNFLKAGTFRHVSVVGTETNDMPAVTRQCFPAFQDLMKPPWPKNAAKRLRQILF